MTFESVIYNEVYVTYIAKVDTAVCDREIIDCQIGSRYICYRCFNERAARISLRALIYILQSDSTLMHTYILWCEKLVIVFFIRVA